MLLRALCFSLWTAVSTATTYGTSIDWVDRGMVLPVSSGGQVCLAHWAIASADALASLQAIRTSTTPQPLSVQQLLDCSMPPLYPGCGGGSMKFAFGYARKYPLFSADAYPYTASNRLCPFVGIIDNNPRGYTVVAPTTVALMTAVWQQPVVAVLRVDQPEFQAYTHGVLTNIPGFNCVSTLRNPGLYVVLVVGYGTEDFTDYWLIQTSYGTNWGAQGYIKLLRDSKLDKTGGMCGILQHALYPVTSPTVPASTNLSLTPQSFDPR